MTDKTKPFAYLVERVDISDDGNSGSGEVYLDYTCKDYPNAFPVYRKEEIKKIMDEEFEVLSQIFTAMSSMAVEQYKNRVISRFECRDD